MARDAGAKRVYFASAAPPIKHPNVYGIDIPTSAELVAFERSVEDVALAIGADKVLYNDLEDVIDAVRSLNQSLTGFDTSCFNGKYVTPEVTEEYLRNLLNGRGLGRTGAKKSATAVAMACNSYNDNDSIDDEHTVKKARVNNENNKSGSFKPSLPPAVPLLRSISDD
jgi:amidophosphoribosyltransferase